MQSEQAFRKNHMNIPYVIITQNFLLGKPRFFHPTDTVSSVLRFFIGFRRFLPGLDFSGIAIVSRPLAAFKNADSNSYSYSASRRLTDRTATFETIYSQYCCFFVDNRRKIRHYSVLPHDTVFGYN